MEEKKEILIINSSNVLWVSPFVIFFGSSGSSVLMFRMMNLLGQHRDQDNSFYILSIIIFAITIFLAFVCFIAFIISIHVLISSNISFMILLFLRIISFIIAILSVFNLASLIVILIGLSKERFFRPIINETIVNIIVYSLIIAIFSVPYLIVLLKINSIKEKEFKESKTEIYNI